MVRYADDILMVFEKEEDARRVMNVLPKRFGKYGLKLHPDKTRLLRFVRPPKWPLNGRGTHPKPSTFDFLGFTHHWARSRKDNWVVKVKTPKSRFSRALHAISRWCAKYRHKPVREQWLTLSKKLKGHYAYYGVTGNTYSINRFWYETGRIWRYWLNKRSSNNPMPYSRFIRMLKNYQLPYAKIVHHDNYQTANPCH